MSKRVQTVMTRGVEGMQLPSSTMQNLFAKAIELREKSPFLVFEPQGGAVNITDGNGKRLSTLNVTLPQKIWIIFDDYGNQFVATALLPSEY